MNEVMRFQLLMYDWLWRSLSTKYAFAISFNLLINWTVVFVVNFSARR
jgi:hypothetical protein